MSRFKLFIFGSNIFKSDAVFLSVRPIRWHLTLICAITGDVNFDQLIKVMYAEIFHCKVIFFLCS